jgi:hypothetical protein
MLTTARESYLTRCLRDLQKIVNDELGRIKELPTKPGWNVNWADLHCTDVNIIFGMWGDVSVEAIVSEGESPELTMHLQNFLSDQGINVDVRTMW